MGTIEGKEVVIGFIKERIGFCTSLLQNSIKYNMPCAVSDNELQSVISNLESSLKQIEEGKIFIENKKFLIKYISDCHDINKQQQDITPIDNKALQEMAARLHNDEKYLLMVYIYALDL